MKVAVIGSGVMGSGIAEVFAIYKNEVLLYDKYEEAIKKGLTNIKWSLEKLSEKRRINETPESILTRIQIIRSLEEVKGSELVIEAVPEDFNLKVSIFKEVE
ncbi:MAG: 3-hydroxyacyl-CoA dehydrogenase NAD-binding domain-containing protein, partial [Sulfolobaceae archaeon]